MTNLPEKYPNEQEELTFLRAFTGAVSQAADLGFFSQVMFEKCYLKKCS